MAFTCPLECLSIWLLPLLLFSILLVWLSHLTCSCLATGQLTLYEANECNTSSQCTKGYSTAAGMFVVSVTKGWVDTHMKELMLFNFHQEITILFGTIFSDPLLSSYWPVLLSTLFAQMALFPFSFLWYSNSSYKGMFSREEALTNLELHYLDAIGFSISFWGERIKTSPLWP